MKYTVLSPWGEIDNTDACALSPRLDTLEGKTIGLFAKFKHHDPVIMKEIARQLGQRYPTAKFIHLQYPKDTAEIMNDPEFLPVLTAFLDQCDGVISGYGDMGSCALFCSYNSALIEKMGKPCVMVSDKDFVGTTIRGAACRGVPHLRYVLTDIKDMSFIPHLDEAFIQRELTPHIAAHLDEIVQALTAPLSELEQSVIHKDNSMANATFTGTLEEINQIFYHYGWTNGSPIVPPTREAVAEMLRGTDLPADYVVAKLPPMLGKATVEKIAINAVMAGCLPTYLPVVIGAVEAMADPCIHLEGYTSSRGSWGPLAIINGPIRNAIGIETGAGVLSQYTKASATIGRAIAYIIMNLSGNRPKLEDLAGIGHEGRMGMCIGEDEENSPWPAIHVQKGLAPDDSAVTMFWPQERYGFFERTTETMLPRFCVCNDLGFDPGCCYLVPESHAKVLAASGYSKEQIMDYVVEYCRAPANKSKVNWVKGNHHERGVVLPVNDGASMRQYWSTEHMMICVAGSGFCSALVGGGDHGGPATVKLHLPKDWDALLRDYPSPKPEYIVY